MIKSALVRLISWHAKGRRAGSRVFYNFAFGYLWSFNNVDFDMATNGEAALVDRLFDAAPDVVFDVGANIGDWSVRVLKRFPNVRVYAFEIAPATHARLQERFKGTGVTVNGFGLSDKTSGMKLKYHPDRNELSSLYLEATQFPWDFEFIDAFVSTGDIYCKDCNIDSIDLLKVDTEGHDIKILLGFRDMIEAGKIASIQFEYNEMAIYSRTFLKDFYELLAERYIIGQILPMGVAFRDYSTLDENFQHSNYLAVLKARPDLTERVRVKP